MFLSTLSYYLGFGSRPQYRITPAASSVNEGATLSYTVNTSGVPNSTTLFWTINFNASSAAADFSATTGSFTITSNTGSFSISPLADATTEGSQTYYVEIRTGSISGPIVTSSVNNITTINDTSLTPAAAFSAPSTTINEGVTTNYNVNTTNYPTGTIFWIIVNGTTAAADFSATSGSFAVASSTGTFPITTVADATTEGAQTFTIELRLNSTSGTLLTTSPTITISDTSLTPAAAFTTTPANIAETPQTVTFVVGTTNFPSGTLWWTINHVTTSAADFSASSGSFTITASSGSFSITALADLATEGNETFTVSVRLTSTTGTILATSATVTVNDTSVTVPGQLVHNGTGTVVWTAPAGVNTVSAVCIGGGGGGVGMNSNTVTQSGAGGGGALYYRNNIPVVPGTAYNLNIVLTAPGFSGGNPYFGAVSANSIGGAGSLAVFGSPTNTLTGALCGAGGGLGGRGLANDSTPYTGVRQGGFGGAVAPNAPFGVGTQGSGGRGGYGGGLNTAGGGGAGGYGTVGGAGAGLAPGATTAGAGGGSGAGAGGGQGTAAAGTTGVNGGGASILGTTPGGGTLFGGGGASGRGVSGLRGGNAAIRIMWPGNSRAYPATGVANQ